MGTGRLRTLRQIMSRQGLSLMVSMAVLAGVAACGSSPKAAKAPLPPAPTPTPTPLTPDSAAKAFSSFTSNDDVARASGDERLALSWTSDGQSAITASAYSKAAFAGEPVPRYRYGKSTLYVPQVQDHYPQWFIAVAERTTEGDNSKHTAIMALVRGSPGARWKLSLSTLLAKGASVPKIAVDKDGYASAVSTFDKSLVFEPRLVGAMQAAMAEEGEHAPAGKVMETGKYTSGYYAEAQANRKRRKEAGLAYNAIFPATTFPIFVLRTADGGGFVLYALARDAVTVRRNLKDGRIAIPREATHLLDKLVPIDLRNELDVVETNQYAAVVPAKPTGKGKEPASSKDKAEVIAFDGAPTRATILPR